MSQLFFLEKISPDQRSDRETKIWNREIVSKLLRVYIRDREKKLLQLSLTREMNPARSTKKINST